MEFYLTSDMGDSIRHHHLKLTEDCQLVTTSTDFARNSCWMEDITSHIHLSSSSKVAGMVEKTCSFNQPQRKKSQDVKSRPTHLQGKWSFSHSQTTIEKCE